MTLTEANNKLEKINNDLFFYVAKLKSSVLKKYGTTNNKFNSTEEWGKNYSKIASKYMSELQRLVDNFKTRDDRKTFELYKNTILSETKKKAEQFVRQAEQDYDLTDREIDELWKIFRNHF